MNITRTISKYWMCQIVGWGLFVFVHIFFALTLVGNYNESLTGRLLVFVCLGFSFSHLMRYMIIKIDILRKSLKFQLIGVIVLTLLFSIMTGFGETILIDVLNLKNKRELHLTPFNFFLDKALNASFYLFLWNCIYFIYHYMEKSRSQQFDTLKLEALVKELELKTIKSHINPHFIFNALNSIRALIDENPSRARDAITELSSILRSSMQAEKQETVSFQKELNIVKDYLALEQIRFEDRLRVEYKIDNATLSQPVPPMMLQTLVENAIKHGISKQVAGGTVRITSSFQGNYHQLMIQNSGKLLRTSNEEGFGLASTRSRLYLMFGEKAGFNIRQVNGNIVVATVNLPIAR